MIIYIFYIIISPILWIALLLISFFNKKIGDHWNQLWISIDSIKDDLKKNHTKKIILFHAASAGEFEQLVPILKLIDKKKYYIIQSFFSPTIFNKTTNNSIINSICYHPFDFIFSSYLFFNSIKPEYYIITRHDIWPSHIIMANFFKIKIILINANLYRESNRLKFPLIHFNKWIYNYFHKILTPSSRIKENLKLLIKEDNIICTGDSRFDRVKDRMIKNNLDFFPKEINNTNNIIFGSIIESDYKLIFESFQNYFPNGEQSLIKKNIRLIFVPHEVGSNTILTIKQKLNKLQMEPILYNKVKEIMPNVVIVNKIGILADLYKYCNFAYVGGGFGAGVHSVIEPAIYNAIVTYGPNIQILDEAIEMTERKIGFIVKNYLDIILYYNLLNNKTEQLKIKTEIKYYVKQKIGASQKIVNEIFH